MADQLSSDLASLRIVRDHPPGPSRLGRVALILAIVAGLIVAAMFVVPKVGARIFKQEVSLTEIALISPVQASVQVTSTGYVIPQLWSKVGAKIPGRISEVLVKEGDVVKAGDVIARLQDADQRSAIAAAESRVQVARARAETARANLAEVGRQAERARVLVAGNAVPRAQHEDLEARAAALARVVESAKAEVAAAEAEVRSLRVGLTDRVITAPIAGTIIGKPAAVGESVGISFGGTSNIVEIADLSSIRVETDVPEARLHMVKPGTPCEIVLDAYPNRRYRGVTEAIGQRVNRAKATVIVKVKFKDDTEGVLPDMAARVSFLTEEIKPESLAEKPKRVVAADAIVERDGRKVLFVVEEGKLRLANVKLGPAVGSSVELVDGPPPGTRVVSKPSGDLYEGQKIKERGK